MTSSDARDAWGPEVAARSLDLPPAASSGPSVMDASILIVDDTEANVVLLDRILSSAGFKKRRGITDSREVLDAVLVGQPDLILLDLLMPHLDGFEVMRALADSEEIDPVPPILVLTAELDQATRRRGLAAGAKDFLTKPYDPGEVLLRCVNLIETWMLQRELAQRNAELENKLVMQSHQLDTEWQERGRLSSSLARLSALAASGTAPRDICSELAMLGPFDRVALIGLDAGEHAVVLGAHDPQGTEGLVNQRLSPEATRYLRSRAARGPWVEASVGDADDDESGMRLAEAGVRSAAYAPITDRQRVVGILAAGSHDELTDADLDASLPTVVAVAAMAGAILGPALRQEPGTG